MFFPGKAVLTLFSIMVAISVAGCKNEDATARKDSKAVGETLSSEVSSATGNAGEQQKQNKVTFLEFGSVNCIPCKMMKPVMEKVENTYPDRVKVVFHDVWTPDGRDLGSAYGVRMIPTQVFLDSEGKEFFRHEGYLPFEQADKILRSHGVGK